MSVQSNELEIACRTLRPGDVVTIKISNYGDRSEPFTVTLTQVDQRESDYTVAGKHGYHKTMPLIYWEPRGEIDMMEMSDGKMMNTAYCDASYVTEIVARKPYRVDYNVVHNSLYSARLYSNAIRRTRGEPINQEYSNTQLQGPLYRVHSPFSFAEDLLSYDPRLVIPQRLSAERFLTSWCRAGYPGLRGGFRWRDEKVIVHYPHNQFTFGGISLIDVVEMVIHRRQFRDWLIASLPNIIRTKKELIADGKRHADLDHQSYIADCESDWKREMNERDDDEDDTFDRHMEEMIDWD